MLSKFKNKRGFTLIELIVVMAVLVIISAIAVPRYLGVQEEAKKGADASTAAMIAKAAELYVASENVTIPIPAAELSTAVTITDLTATGKYMDVDTESQLQYYKTADSTVVITLATDGTCETVAIAGKTLFPRPDVLPDLVD